MTQQQHRKEHCQEIMNRGEDERREQVLVSYTDRETVLHEKKSEITLLASNSPILSVPSQFRLTPSHLNTLTLNNDMILHSRMLDLSL